MDWISRLENKILLGNASWGIQSKPKRQGPRLTKNEKQQMTSKGKSVVYTTKLYEFKRIDKIRKKDQRVMEVQGDYEPSLETNKDEAVIKLSVKNEEEPQGLVLSSTTFCCN